MKLIQHSSQPAFWPNNKKSQKIRPILTAKIGTNADLFPDILKLYVPEGSRVLDITYGKGTFWKNVDVVYDLIRNDIDPNLGDVHYDFFAHMPWNTEFDAVIFDPPYMHGSKAPPHPELDKSYQNFKRPSWGTKYVHKMYFRGLEESHRLLKSKGVAIIKCMDQIESGKQHRDHIVVWQMAMDMGFIDEDLFVLMRTSSPMMRHKYQLHARKNNSFFWVFRKKK